MARADRRGPGRAAASAWRVGQAVVPQRAPQVHRAMAPWRGGAARSGRRSAPGQRPGRRRSTTRALRWALEQARCLPERAGFQPAPRPPSSARTGWAVRQGRRLAMMLGARALRDGLPAQPGHYGGSAVPPPLAWAARRPAGEAGATRWGAFRPDGSAPRWDDRCRPVRPPWAWARRTAAGSPARRRLPARARCRPAAALPAGKRRSEARRVWSMCLSCPRGIERRGG